MCNHSFSSCDRKVELFQRMFPDSKVATKMCAGRTKMSYLLNYGIAPYMQGLLAEHIKDQDSIVLLFDESLNKDLGQKQMDIHVRFWDVDKVIFLVFLLLY